MGIVAIAMASGVGRIKSPHNYLIVPYRMIESIPKFLEIFVLHRVLSIEI